MNLISYLLHRPMWQKLPMLPRMYSSEFESELVNQDEEMLMKLSHTRCPRGVEILKKQHNTATARTLIEQLPKRKHKRYIMRRFRWLICRATGTLPYDPMKRIASDHIRQARADGRR